MTTSDAAESGNAFCANGPSVYRFSVLFDTVSKLIVVESCSIGIALVSRNIEYSEYFCCDPKIRKGRDINILEISLETYFVSIERIEKKMKWINDEMDYGFLNDYWAHLKSHALILY